MRNAGDFPRFLNRLFFDRFENSCGDLFGKGFGAFGGEVDVRGALDFGELRHAESVEIIGWDFVRLHDFRGDLVVFEVMQSPIEVNQAPGFFSKPLVNLLKTRGSGYFEAFKNISSATPCVQDRNSQIVSSIHPPSAGDGRLMRDGGVSRSIHGDRPGDCGGFFRGILQFSPQAAPDDAHCRADRQLLEELDDVLGAHPDAPVAGGLAEGAFLGGSMDVDQPVVRIAVLFLQPLEPDDAGDDGVASRGVWFENFTGAPPALENRAFRGAGADLAGDGVPPLADREHYATWSRIVGEEYEALVRHANDGTATLLDTYGATNPAEFFAVATECFFEKPRSLERHRPELYAELRRFYRRDPAALARGEPERLEEG